MPDNEFPTSAASAPGYLAAPPAEASMRSAALANARGTDAVHSTQPLLPRSRSWEGATSSPA